MKIKIRKFKNRICLYLMFLIFCFKSIVFANELINQKGLSFSLIKRKVLYSKTNILEKSQNNLEDKSKKESSNSFNINILSYIKEENNRDTINGK